MSLVSSFSFCLRRGPIVIGLVAAALIAGCGGDDSGGTSGGGGSASTTSEEPASKGSDAADPCALLSAADATEALGRDVEPAKHEDDEMAQMCRYVGKPDSSSPSDVLEAGEVSLAIYKNPSSKAAFEQIVSSLPSGETVDGIGDAAGQAGDQLYFLRGDRMYIVALWGPDNKDEARTALAKKIAGQL